MKLCYLSYPIIDQDKVPEWIANFAQHPLVQREAWGIYDPALGFRANYQNVRCIGPLSEVQRVAPKGVQHREAFKLDRALFEPMTRETLQRIDHADTTPSTDIPFKHLYALLRADVVLVDLDLPDHGESHEVLYAYLLGVPVIGVSGRFLLSPWMAEKCSVVVFDREVDAIVRQVLAHDRLVSAVLRGANEDAARQRKTIETLEKLKALGAERPTEQPVITPTPEAQDRHGAGEL